MKKYIIGIILSLFIGINTVSAYEITADDTINLKDEITSSSFAFGNIINDESKINGLGVMFGNSLNIASQSDYSINFGNAINYKGTTKDLIIFGNKVVIEKDAVIERDLIIFASDITIKGQVGGSIRIVSKDALISTGTTLENVHTTCDSLVIDGNTTINNLTYVEDTKIALKDGNIINKGMIETNDTDKKDYSTINSIFLSLVSNWLIFAVMLLVVPKLLTVSKDNYGKIVGYGVGYMIAMPIISLLLLLSIYGSKLSIVFIIMYVVSMLTATPITGYIIGKSIWDKFIKKDESGKEDYTQYQMASAMLSYINANSVGINDGINFVDDCVDIEQTKETFRMVFALMNQEQHYEMMMGSN